MSGLTYVVMEFVLSSHPVAEATECIRDSSIVSNVGPLGAPRVAAILGQRVASEKAQQQGQNRGEVERHVGVLCFWTMIRDCLLIISVTTFR